MDALVGQLLSGVVLPAALAATILAAACAGPLLPRGRAWAAALALVLGFLAAFQGLKGLPLPFARESLHVVAQAAVVGLGLGLLESLAPRWRGAAWGLRAAAVVGLVVLTVKRKGSVWNEPGLAAETVVALAAGWCLLWLSVDLLRGALPGKPTEDPGSGGGAAALALLAGVGAGSAVLALGGSMIVGQLGGALAMSFLPLVAACWWRPELPIFRAAAPPLALTWGALLANASLFVTDLPRAIPVLLALAPLAANLVRVPFLRARPAWQRALAAVAGVLVPVAVAGALAWQKTEEMGGIPF